MKRKDIQIIAYYLPQFHSIPENDLWWGKDFTEWVNVKKAKPLFKGHKQPNVPAPEIGYYNLLDDEIRRKQSVMARQAGIDGFCYWHYWFGNGRELLEQPFRRTFADKSNDFGFCLGWANESWKRKQWSKGGVGDVTLIEQTYPGRDDDKAHFYAYLDAFKDERYIRIDGKPLFLIYRPAQHPDLKGFITYWNELARENGLSDGFCFICELGYHYSSEDKKRLIDAGVDYMTVSSANLGYAPFFFKIWYVLKNFLLRRPIRVIGYGSYLKWAYTRRDNRKSILPCVYPNWDHSPRSGKKCTILHDSRPELFKKLVKKTLRINSRGKNLPVLFIKSWNEWGEGNYMEPDTVFSDGYLSALKSAIDESL